MGRICPEHLLEAVGRHTGAHREREQIDGFIGMRTKEVCAQEERCRYDGGAVYAYRFGTDQLSHWDWFHPSVNGQARLAEIAYRKVRSVT